MSSIPVTTGCLRRLPPCLVPFHGVPPVRSTVFRHVPLSSDRLSSWSVGQLSVNRDSVRFTFLVEACRGATRTGTLRVLLAFTPSSRCGAPGTLEDLEPTQTLGDSRPKVF